MDLGKIEICLMAILRKGKSDRNQLPFDWFPQIKDENPKKMKISNFGLGGFLFYTDDIMIASNGI